MDGLRLNALTRSDTVRWCLMRVVGARAKGNDGGEQGKLFHFMSLVMGHRGGGLLSLPESVPDSRFESQRIP